jgi:hypothetical protein
MPPPKKPLPETPKGTEFGPAVKLLARGAKDFKKGMELLEKMASRLHKKALKRKRKGR